MKAIIEALQNTVEIAKARAREYTQGIAKNDGVAAQNEKKALELEVLARELSKRESAVSHVENVDNLIKETEAKIETLNKGLEKLDENKKAFEIYKHEQTQLLNNRTAEVTQAEKEVERRKANIEKEISAKLDALVKNYKR